MRSLLIKDLLVESKDGDWGADFPTPDHSPRWVIRGADFPRVIHRDVSSVPLRYLPDRTVARRTLAAEDILLETAGGTQGRPTGRTVLVTQELLDALPGDAIGASFTRFLRVDQSLIEPRYLYWFLRSMYDRGEMAEYHVQHTGVGRFQYTVFANSKQIPIIARSEQRGIAEILGALDDKISANAKLVSIIDRLQELQVRKASCGARGKRLDSITRMIARGITPKYSDASDSVIVLNQKCVRDRRVSLTPARLTNVASTRDAKMLEVDDALVNSTGQGTLGRAARWSQESPATVDSHITIVRFDPESVDPTFASIALSNTERQLESLAEGSTGQTELRRSLLQSFELALPDLNLQRNVGSALRALGGRADAAQSESAQLAQTRDALLHPLISGRLKVKDAERVVEGVV